ncbi:Dihydrolipoamide succinyltransferase [Moelleriella libera RCEF 2490]|uniref:dihydrolipoyllysine-residue succinyltransferase n=1 Tax=Moelleriella libera RCEF 2490 TaxID=1081109 RepID=A0A168A2J5_9HYPO|nr:Dihydrolipoamide succinyltransferase [Moelleriella libera RCEF 2490]
MLARRIATAGCQAFLRPSRSRQPCLLLAKSPNALRFARWYADIVVKVPQMAESISEGTLKQLKSVGDHVEQDEEIATIETDKIDVAVNAPEAGTIKEFFANEEDTVTTDQDLARIEVGQAPSDSKKDDSSSKQDEPELKEEKKDTEEASGVQKSESPPQRTEPKQAEARSAEKPASLKTKEPEVKSESAQGAGSKATEGGRDERRVKMNRMRLRIAERLKQSQNTAASLTTFNEVDMANIMDFRKLYKDDVLKKTGVKLGFMSAFSRAAVLAMRDIPAVNASIEGPNGGDTIVYRDYVDISVAVATEKGLVTPVVRNVETMDLVTIEKSIADMGKKAREGKLTIEDMAGGTFTISNGGVFGSLMGTPIINLPQSAVLGLHAIKDRAVVVNGKVEVRPMMYLALTYDHRLLDGREAVQFLVKIKEYIEDPRRMLL